MHTLGPEHPRHRATTMTVFDLVGRNLKLNTEADVAPYLEELRKIEPLHEVHLGGNTLGVEACQALAKVLKTKRTIKVADFADIFTGRLITEIPDALRALCDALVDQEELEEINLSDNAFGGRSAEPMVHLLTNNHHFHTLKLSNNGLGVSGGTIVADALTAAAEKLRAAGRPSQLHTIICGRNRLENGSAPAWARAFATHRSLVEVRMYQNGIRMEGIEALCEALAACPHLKVLDLQDNTATLRGSRAVARALPYWPDLRVLNLSDCLVKSKGGVLLFDALAQGHAKGLQSLHLQYCDLNREALSRLAGAIGTHLNELTLLEINGNFADEDDEVITQIVESLEKWGNSHALDELDEMDPDGEEEDEEEDEDTEDALDEKLPRAGENAEADKLADELAGTHLK